MAFKKPVECNCYVVYGAFCNIGDISNAMKIHNYKGDKKDFVESFGLQIIPVGDNNTSQEYIVGKSLDYQHNFLALKIKKENNDIYLEHMNKNKVNYEIETKEQLIINTALYKCGIMKIPRIYLAHNYIVNR